MLPLARILPSRYGPMLRVRREDFTNRAALFGLYGQEIADWIKCLGPNGIFLDIGANAGIFSLLASKSLISGEVFAFEPNPVVFDELRFNIRINDASNITAFNAALSDRTGTFALTHNPQHTGNAAINKARSKPTSAPLSREHIVLAIAPKYLHAITEAAGNQAVCIKIDVEGHEFQVLKGLRDAGLLSSARWVIVEIDATHLARFGATVDDVYAIMKNSNLLPTKGVLEDEHYDEIFIRPNQPKPGGN